MRRLIHNLTIYRERTRSFFDVNGHEVALTNIRYLRFATTATLLLLVSLMLLAHFIIDGWSPSPAHLLFVPVTAAFCAFSWFASPRLSLKLAMPSCILYEVVLYAFIIAVDVFSDPAAPSSFMQLVCIALPSVFVLRDRFTYGILFLAEAAYLVAVLQFKDPGIAQYDIFGLVAGALFSVCVSYIVMGYRLAAFESRMKYERLSRRDVLSNLFNKRAFTEQAQDYLTSSNPRTTCSLAFIDLDDFKHVNDTFGHQAGDVVLADMGRILLGEFRHIDIVGRFGGDEYLVLARGLADPAILRHRFDRIRDKLMERADAELHIPLTCSVGVAIAAEDDVSFDDLVKRADELLYRAKEAGKGRTVIGRYRADGAGAPGTAAAE